MVILSSILKPLIKIAFLTDSNIQSISHSKLVLTKLYHETQNLCSINHSLGLILTHYLIFDRKANLKK